MVVVRITFFFSTHMRWAFGVRSSVASKLSKEKRLYTWSPAITNYSPISSHQMLRHNIRRYVVSCSLTLTLSARASFLSQTYPAKHPHLLPTKTKAIRYPTSCIRTNARTRNIINIATPVLRGCDDGVDEDSKEQSYKKESKMKILSPFVSVFSAAALLSIGGTLWSEYTVIMTGCGPMLLPDVVERSCYLGVLVIAGSSGESRS